MVWVLSTDISRQPNRVVSNNNKYPFNVSLFGPVGVTLVIRLRRYTQRFSSNVEWLCPESGEKHRALLEAGPARTIVLCMSECWAPSTLRVVNLASSIPTQPQFPERSFSFNGNFCSAENPCMTVSSNTFRSPCTSCSDRNIGVLIL